MEYWSQYWAGLLWINCRLHWAIRLGLDNTWIRQQLNVVSLMVSVVAYKTRGPGFDPQQW